MLKSQYRKRLNYFKDLSYLDSKHKGIFLDNIAPNLFID